MKRIPIVLIIFRLLLGPVMIALTYRFGAAIRFELVALMVLGLLSDIFDGIAARKAGVSSPQLRRMDSQTDLVFWLCVGWCSWLLNQEVILAYKIPITVVFVMEAMTYVVSIAKFGKETCTHALLSKLWGLTLLAVFVAIIGFSYGGWAMKTAVFFGLISHLDVFLIILLLPKWTYDVPSFYHAYLIRKGIPFKRNTLFHESE
ncbi:MULTISPECIES: CDP-alcohol phosphatidyltransferase family protein [unclassified Flavobacterium]|uniref:CDP-alcohol phosphatidyltransferase family protein n=1 Tax=unclassified Flavobacterium TaxID=196869 RepID=UPI00086E8C36|nr:MULTISPECIES: CDP-alcohol phosphatidyltransferase family protein [unclassified Flavobacterium]MBN9284035.1 CDP-alcohol phosphatidyltransferase family protein [Flavobacterium sp.]ODS82524.1 MAG: CDP-alcohol phosphatidyltransferase [Chryseobacterium sp. SCN 40-13]OJV73440.1 MAG: CDP-alcohol phosphatidyltransferase [Flavobacterium sp. 40-81]